MYGPAGSAGGADGGLSVPARLPAVPVTVVFADEATSFAFWAARTPAPTPVAAAPAVAAVLAELALPLAPTPPLVLPVRGDPVAAPDPELLLVVDGDGPPVAGADVGGVAGGEDGVGVVTGAP